MKESFNFCQSGKNRYVGFSKRFRAEITRDDAGKRHMTIGFRNDRSRKLLFSTSAISVQSCKKTANEFLKEAR